MLTVNREQLKHILDTHEQSAVLMAGDSFSYQKAHIPGSILVDSPARLEQVDRQAEIIVYCTNPVCYTSYALYRFLQSRGYRNVRRYAGGLEDWAAAGYQLEGTLIL